MDIAALSDRLDRWSIPEPNSGCILWLGHEASTGYGELKVSPGRKRWHAHRLAWTLANGPIPKGMCVCHKCDVRLCLNPYHLFLGTRADNCRDRHRKGRTIVALGEKQGNARLSSADVIAIRADASRSGAQLASLYGVSRNTIYSVW